jgi:tRNA pseudouridine65 synthase
VLATPYNHSPTQKNDLKFKHNLQHIKREHYWDTTIRGTLYRHFSDLRSLNSDRLAILYKDDFLLAVSKPAGMIVHRGQSNDAVTVADIVRDEIIKAPVHAVHRLDRGTSGVLIFALSPESARQIQAQTNGGGFSKRYVALVRGPMKTSCRLEHAIKQRDCDERVNAITEFMPLQHSGRWSLVEAVPITGRTHQIRLHLKHLSHPIVGDVRYGKGDINRFFREAYNLSRLALHSVSVTMKHPQTQREMIIRAPLADDLAKILDQLNIDAHHHL